VPRRETRDRAAAAAPTLNDLERLLDTERRLTSVRRALEEREREEHFRQAAATRRCAGIVKKG